MKKSLKKWIIRLIAIGLLLTGILLALVFNPGILYTYKTILDNYTVLHNSPLNKELFIRLENIPRLVQKSEFYDADLPIYICLNDGSLYPALLSKIRGKAFGFGFYNIIVLQGNANYRNNYVELNGLQWNLEQLIAHEAIHCYQFNELGFFHSNPIAKYPNWKWEGYPEYVSRQNPSQKDLFQNIEQLLNRQNKEKDIRFMEFSDGTIASLNYYKDWLLVSYCLDIKGFSYQELLEDSTGKAKIEEEMKAWYQDEYQKNTKENNESPQESIQYASLQIVHKFELAPEKVFAAFTEPDAMRVWWTEQTSFDIDLRVGGSWKIIRKEGGEVYTALGEYLEVQKPHRLVYSYAMPQFSSNVDTIFIDIASTGTSSSVLTFKQKGEDINTELQDLPAEGLSMSEVGWRKGFDLMAKAWEK